MTAPDLFDRPLEELISLKGKVAVITGGARGIGRAIARRLHEAGAKIAIVDKRELHETGDGEEGYKGYIADVRDSEAVEQAAEQIVRDLGAIDIWVNDAGIFPPKPFFELTDEDWADVLDTNLTGTFYGTRAAAKRMKAQGRGGVIVNLASISGYKGEEQYAHYCASKFGVRGFTAAAAKELAPHDIRVVAVAPTLIDTPGIWEYKEEMDELSGKDVFADYRETLPLGRPGTPDDVGRVVLFAVSGLAAFVTGSTIQADAGELVLG